MSAKTGAGGWVIICFVALNAVGCEQEPGEPSPADRALEEIQRVYDQAKEKAPEDPVGWAREDIERHGDWEYRIISVADEEPAKLEKQLNELGRERWEVFWVERSGADLRLFLKRPAISYLRSVPLSKLGKALSGGESGE